MKYNVMSIPTVIFFKNGEIVAQEVGLQGKAHILKSSKNLKHNNKRHTAAFI